MGALSDVRGGDSPHPHLIIRPRGRWSIVSPRELWEFRDLLVTFAVRDITLRYRQTALGVAWVVLLPLLGAVLFAFVFGRIANLPSDGVPYVEFAYAGLMAWNAFNSLLTKAAGSVVGNAAMVSKVYFPRFLLPVSTIGSVLLDFVIALVAMALLMGVYGVHPGVGGLLLPVWLLLVLSLALGMGLLASALMVRYRDVQNVLPILLQLMLYASPVAYGLDAVPSSLRIFVAANPMTGLLEAFRWSLLGVGPLPGRALVWSSAASMLAIGCGAFAFASLERDFADVI